jgi:hypothetical protein
VWETTAVAKTNENGEIALSKGDNDIFTRAWTITDAMLNLTTDERALLDQFEQKWFDGYSLYAGSPVYENALPVFLKHEGLLRTVRASKGIREHQIPWTTPEQNPDYKDSSPWPKYRTREMKELGLTYRPYRAWYRKKVRDQIRAGFTLELYTLVKVRDENAAMKAKLGEIDELKSSLSMMQATLEEMEKILDEQDRPRFHARKRWMTERRGAGASSTDFALAPHLSRSNSTRRSFSSSGAPIPR